MEDTRREATSDEAYRLDYNIGTAEELARLRAEVRPPKLMERPKESTRNAAAAAGPLKAAIAGMPVRYKVRIICVAGILVILVIAGHVVGGDGIKVGDCVTTFTNPLDDNSHIFKASCSNAPKGQYYKVLQVQDSTGGECSLGDTTFQDDPANKTYCLETVAGTP